MVSLTLAPPGKANLAEGSSKLSKFTLFEFSIQPKPILGSFKTS